MASTDGESPAPAPHPRVLAQVTGPESTRDAFTASLKELLNRLSVELVADGTTQPEDGHFLAVAQIAFSDAGCALSVDDAEGRLGVKRRLAGAGPVVVETAAHVVQSAVEELVLPALARRVETPKPTRSPPLVAASEAPEVAKAAPPPTQGGLAVGLFAGVRSLSQKAPAVLAVGVDTSYSGELFHRLVGGGLSLTYAPEIETATENVGLRVQGLSPRARAQVQLLGGDAWGLDLGLGGGADLFLTHVTSSLVPPNRFRPLRLDATPVLTASLTWHHAIAENASVFVGLASDVDLSPITFTARLGPDTETLLTSWSVRPMLTVGVTFSPGDRLVRGGGGAP